MRLLDGEPRAAIATEARGGKVPHETADLDFYFGISPDAIRDILECLGLSARPPPVAPPALGGLLPADR